jgi:CTP synthase (UTP-ammonia lyase)
MAVSIAVLGDRNTDHLTHREIDATLELMPADVDARWLPSPEAESAVEADGLWVVPGTPYRDGGAVLAQIRRARTAGMPILGTCGGFQHMLVEFARNAAGLEDAAHAETDPDAADPVVARLSCSLVVSARAPDAGVEAVELPGHPFYVATLFQPQVGSSASGRLHPLIDALISAARGADPVPGLAKADRLVGHE